MNLANRISEATESINIKPFRARKGFYVYDAYSNGIFEVDKDFFKILRSLNCRGCLSQRFSDGSIQEFVDIISELQEEGAFKPFSVKGFTPTSKFFNERQKGTAVFPFNLILNVTQECNMRCKYCNYSELYPGYREHSNKEMSKEVARKAIRLLKKESKNQEKVVVSFYGGEPLLNLELIKETVEYAEDFLNKEVSFQITTNGLNLDSTVEYLVEKDFDVSVSLDCSKEVHNDWRIDKKGEPTFERVYQNLKKLKKGYREFFNENLVINAVLAPPYPILKVNNFFESNKMLKNSQIKINLMEDIGCKNYRPLIEKENKKYRKKREKLKEGYIDDILEGKIDSVSRNFFEKRLAKIHNRNITPVGERISPNSICYPGNEKLFVETEGTLHTCERVGCNFPIGTVEYGINREKIYDLVERYKRISFEDCSKCWCARICDACFVNASHGKKLNIKTKRKECLREKKANLEALKIYTSILEEDEKALDFLN